jgi:hypothetical protein
MNARFNRLDPEASYLIIDGETGHSKGDGVQGAEAMAQTWNENDEAWPEGETEFRGSPVDVATEQPQ